MSMRVMVVMLALAAAACGSSPEKRAAADANAAGFVPPSVTSRVDFGSAQERRFRRFDHNDDDVLTGTEMPTTDSRLMALDRNRDGEITSSEWSEGQMNRFDSMDLNKDGTLTSDERVDARGS